MEVADDGRGVVRRSQGEIRVGETGNVEKWGEKRTAEEGWSIEERNKDS